MQPYKNKIPHEQRRKPSPPFWEDEPCPLKKLKSIFELAKNLSFQRTFFFKGMKWMSNSRSRRLRRLRAKCTTKEVRKANRKEKVKK